MFQFVGFGIYLDRVLFFLWVL